MRAANPEPAVAGARSATAAPRQERRKLAMPAPQAITPEGITRWATVLGWASVLTRRAVLTVIRAAAAACTAARIAPTSARDQSHDHGPLRTVVGAAVTLPRQGR
jgi:hypothetical protein